MKRVCFALAAAALVAAALPFPAQNTALAYCRGCAVDAGAIGGVAAGVIIGSAIANSGPRADAPPPLESIDSEVSSNEVTGSEDLGNEALGSAACHSEQQRRWVDGVGYRWRNTEICE